MFKVGRFMSLFASTAKELIGLSLSVAIIIGGFSFLNVPIAFFWVGQLWVFLTVSAGMIIGYLKAE